MNDEYWEPPDEEEMYGETVNAEIERITKQLDELIEACRRTLESYLEDKALMSREVWRRALVDSTLPYDDFVAEYGEPMQYVKDFSASLN